MADGFTVDPDSLLKNGNSLAMAAGYWQDCGTSLTNATMAADLLGLIGSQAKLPDMYNKARTAVTDKITQGVTSMENSVKSLETVVHNYNGTDQASMDKIVYAGSDLNLTK